MGDMSDLLDETAVTESLKSLPGWERDGDSLVRTATLPTFKAAITVVGDLAEIAESRDHHPDIDIRWRTLTFRCSTHSAGGITRLDVTLAAEISGVLESAGG